MNILLILINSKGTVHCYDLAPNSITKVRVYVGLKDKILITMILFIGRKISLNWIYQTKIY